jgi:cell division protein FtsB
MTTEDVQGFVINQKTLSFLLALLTLISIVIGGVTVFNNYTFRIDQLEKQNTQLLAEVTNLNKKIDLLSEKIINLTISLNRVEDRSAAKK